MNKRLAFGVIFDWIGSPYHTGIISGISQFTLSRDIDTYCFITGRINSPNDWEKKKNLLFYFPKREKIDGLIITCPAVSNIIDEKELIDFLKIYRDIPIVTLGMSVNDFPSVETDNEGGFRKLIEHLLINHKVRKIAFIQGPEGNPEARIRKAVFLKVIKENEIDLKNILFVEGDFSILSGRNATKKIFDEEGFFPEVIISSNDQMALGVIEELEFRKIKVPEQILVTGFDNVDLSIEKGLTTVHQPISELGYKSAELLLDHINNNIKEKRIVLSTHPIFRTSCSCKEGDVLFESSMKIKPLAHETLIEKMNDMGEQLITSFELKRQINIFEDSMKFMGVGTFLLAVYENSEKPFYNSRIISAVLENKKVALREDVFKTTDLFPEEIYKHKKSAKTYIIQGLFHGDKQIGFFVMDFFVTDGMIYETIRQKLSVALRISSLIGELKDYSQNLEKLVEEKTKDLKRINQKLQEEIEVRKKMEERLKRSEEKFKDIANFLPTIIFETDLNFKIEFINQTGIDFFEIEEKNKLNLLDFVMDEDREKIKLYCVDILSSNNSNFKEFRIVTKRGKKQTLLAKALPIVKNRQIKGLRWSCMDLKSFTNSFLIPEEAFFKKYNLTQRQKEVFLLLLEGYKVKNIASKLFISESTVKNHISAIYDEMGVKNKTEFYNALKEYQLKQFGYESFIFSVLAYLIKDENSN